MLAEEQIDYHGEIVQFFKSHKRKSEATFDDYIGWIRSVLKVTGISRAENYDLWYAESLKACEDFVKFALKDRRSATMQIIDWINTTENKGTSISSKLAAVKSLCDWCEAPLPWKKIKGVAPKKIDPDMPAPPKEAMRKLYSILDPRGRAMLSLNMAASRLGAYRWFRMKYLQEIIVNGSLIGKITIYPGEAEEYVSYIPSGGMKDIKFYHDLRRQSGEILNGDSPIIRDKFEKYTHEVKMIQPGTVERLFHYWWEKAGFPTLEASNKGVPGTVRDWAVCHGCRKYAQTQLELAGMPHEDSEILLGHKFRYKKPDDYDLAQIFEKFQFALELTTEGETERRNAKLVKENHEVKENLQNKVDLLLLKNEQKDRELEKEKKDTEQYREAVRMLIDKLDDTGELKRRLGLNP